MPRGCLPVTVHSMIDTDQCSPRTSSTSSFRLSQSEFFQVHCLSKRCKVKVGMAVAKGTLVLTGANGGLGTAIAKQIVSNGEIASYHGLYLVRDVASAAALNTVLATNSQHSYEVLSMDLTDMDSVRQASKTIDSRISSGQIPSVKALILNAGYQDFGKQTWTKDGLDPTFSANYLGHWLLSLLLLKNLDKDSGRIVIVGSQAHEYGAYRSFPSTL